MNSTQVNRLVRDSLANIALNTASRIQKRRQGKGKKRLVNRDLSAMPRRQGGVGRNGPITPQIAARTVAANIGTSVGGLQSAASQIISGSENIAKLANIGGTTGFTVINETSLNPSEPGLAPSLAAIANQFQRFKTRIMKLTYTPIASAAINGTVYISVFPDPKTPKPTSTAEMVASGNMKQFPIYGTAQSWTVPMASLQAAYLVQTVKCPETYNDDEPTQSSGIAFTACDGVAVNTQIGTLTWTYSYQLSTKKLGSGANTHNAHWVMSDFTQGAVIHLTDADLASGWGCLIPTVTPGTFRMRIRSAPHLVIVKAAGTTTPVLTAEVSYDSGQTWVAQPEEHVCVNAVSTESSWLYRLPIADMVRFATTMDDLTAVRVDAASLRG